MQSPKTYNERIKPQDKVHEGFYSERYTSCTSDLQAGTKFRDKLHKYLIDTKVKMDLTRLYTTMY